VRLTRLAYAERMSAEVTRLRFMLRMPFVLLLPLLVLPLARASASAAAAIDAAGVGFTGMSAWQPSDSLSSLPALPVVALEQFPEASRAALKPVFEKARRAPDDELSVGLLAMTLHAWEQWEAAHAAYQRAIGLARFRAKGVERAARARIEKSVAIEARARADSSSAGPGPQAWKWKYLDAVVLQRLARPNEAANVLHSSAGPSGSAAAGMSATVDAAVADAAAVSYLPAKVKLAEALFESGEVDASARLYRELVKEPAAEPIAELGLGRVAAAAGRHEEAAGHFARAIALFPEFGAAHYALARSARALGRTDESQRALERHQQFGARWPALDDPLLSEVASLRTDARASLQRGAKLAEAGDAAGAIAAHEAALTAMATDTGSSTSTSASPSSAAQAHVELITLYGRLSNWTKAEEHYRAAVALGSELEAAHYNYGVLLGLQDRRGEAIAAYRSALDINPQNPQARNNLGHILERDRQYEDAAAEYRRVVDVMPTFRLARFNLGRMLIVLGRPLDAVAQLERLTEPRDAETPRYLFALATAKIRAGQRDDGVKWAQEAKQLAVEHGQQDLAAAIERDLAALSGGR
jgi:tetratricopeptide (TPR) repeat protein